MKKYFSIIVLTPFLLYILSVNGCILDAFNTFFVNIPYSINISTSGVLSTISESKSFCLDESKTYEDYKDDIKSIKLIRITFRPTFVDPSNLSGDVTVNVMTSTGTMLFTHTLNNVAVSNYLPPNAPYELELSPGVFDGVNNYLEGGGRCFRAELIVNNIVPAVGTKTLEASIDIVFEAETEP
jgi:hypothetical protein